MTDKTKLVRPVAAAVGVAFVSSLAVSSTAIADDNPFETTDLDSGYLLAGNDKDKDEEGSCGEGSCGGDKDKEGSCGEGSCGGDKDEEGSCGGDHKDGEGSCGGDKGEEGSCGGDKGEEGSCGGDKGEEGSCGGNKD